MLEATRIAFCRLGDVAAPALPQVEAMISGGVVPAFSLTGHRGSDWNLTLVRLGRPLETIRKPESLSGTDAAHRRNLQRSSAASIRTALAVIFDSASTRTIANVRQSTLTRAD